MAFRQDQVRRFEDERERGFVPHAVGNQYPVMDHGVALYSGQPAPFVPTFRRPSDRRPGTPLPPEMTGDPHPDRLARAEALRELLCKRDNRLKIEGSVDRENIRDALPRKGKGHAAATPDIDKPRATYVPVPREIAKIEARRGSTFLLFPTVSAAAFCMTGERCQKWEKAIYNASGGVTTKAFGWEWTRLRERRGKAL